MGTVAKVFAAVGYVALWAGYLLYTERNPDAVPSLGVEITALVITSIGLGFVIARWWAPLVVAPYLVAVALPSSYTGDPDYGVGLYFALVVLLPAAVLIALGVFLGRSS